MVTSVTNVQVSKNGHDYVYQEYCGLSTDSKPTTKVFNGSTFLEMDTGDSYVFDAESMTWRNPWAKSYPVLQDKEVTIAENGQTIVEADANYDGLSSVKIAVNVPTGGVSSLSKGVNFIDYDGTVVATWEASTIASKTAMPDNPSHDGLTAQGWNWSLADIQSYIASYPDALVTVGQMYITDDGKTRIYIHLEKGRLSPYLGICPNGSVDIDWGDGTAHDTVIGTSETTVKNTQHTYVNGGDYVISLTVTGSMGIVGDSSCGSQLLWKNSTDQYINRVYQNAVRKVEIGNSITSIGESAFDSCYSLASIIIPSSVTSIEKSAFNSCYNLTSVIIPSSITSFEMYVFNSCYGLASVTIPSSIMSIGTAPFIGCNSLKNVTIPSSVTSIGDYAFNYCYSLTSIIIPSSVTSIEKNTFNSCYGLASVTIPSSVTSIENSAFGTCVGLSFIKFTSQIPPTVSSMNAWQYIPNDCIIYVPSGTLNAYKSATNYPNPSTYTYVEY